MTSNVLLCRENVTFLVTFVFPLPSEGSVQSPSFVYELSNCFSRHTTIEVCCNFIIFVCNSISFVRVFQKTGVLAIRNLLQRVR